MARQSRRAQFLRREWMRLRQSLSTALLIGVLSLAPRTAPAQDDAGWQFSATVYGWFPDIGGHTRFQSGAGGEIDVDISTILDHLKMTFQGSFEARKARWGLFNDLVYLDVGES